MASNETANENLVSELRQLNTNLKKLEAKLPVSKNRNNLVIEKTPYLSVSLRIQSEWGTIQTWITPNKDIFYALMMRAKLTSTKAYDFIIIMVKKQDPAFYETYVMFCAILYHLYNLTNVKNTHGGALL